MRRLKPLVHAQSDDLDVITISAALRDTYLLDIVGRSDIDFIDPSEWPVGEYIFGEFPPGDAFVQSCNASTIVIENSPLE